MGSARGGLGLAHKPARARRLRTRGLAIPGGGLPWLAPADLRAQPGRHGDLPPNWSARQLRLFAARPAGAGRAGPPLCTLRQWLVHRHLARLLYAGERTARLARRVGRLSPLPAPPSPRWP